MSSDTSFWDQFEETPGPYSTSQAKNPTAEKAESKGFDWDSYEEAPSTPWYKSIPSAAAKGILEGIIDFGESVSPLIEAPGVKEQHRAIREKTHDKILPSNEAFVENVARRGGKMIPGMAAGPGGIPGKLIRTGLAAVSGETAKELGFDETGQALAELPALIGPAMKGKINPTKAQAPIVEEARRLGLTEKQIAPLIQSEKKQNVLKKFASRGDRTQEILKGSKAAVDNIYETIGASPAAKNVIAPDIQQKLSAAFKNRFEQLPDELRKKISPDVKDLVKGDITGEKLINFWQDLNHHIKKGDGKLGILKEPLLKAMEGVSPEFARDFQTANQLYARSAKIRRSLSPKDENIVSKFLDATAPYQLVGAMVSGYAPAIVTVLGEVGARKLSALMLTNPRFQNISKQIVIAVADNKIQLALNLRDVLKEDLEKESPDAAVLLDYLDFSPSK